MADVMQRLSAANTESVAEFGHLHGAVEACVQQTHVSRDQALNAVGHVVQAINNEASLQRHLTQQMKHTVCEAVKAEDRQTLEMMQTSTELAKKHEACTKVYGDALHKSLAVAQASSDSLSVWLKTSSDALIADDASRATKLDDLHHSVEHFFQQEVQRFESDGTTPLRKKRRITAEALVTVTEPEHLLEAVYADLTPVRRVKLRDSILVKHEDEPSVPSPATLKENIRRNDET